MAESNSRIIKIGGSLFALDDFPRRLKKFLDGLPPARTVLVAGGGKLVDQVRGWDQRFPIDQVKSHEMSCRLLSVTAKLISSLVGDSVLVHNVADVVKLSTRNPNADSMLIVLDPSQWALEQDELDASWSVTSDSIAALACQRLKFGELVLLKSALPATRSIEDAVAEGFVDECFEAHAMGIEKIRCVNLSVEPFEERLLK